MPTPYLGYVTANDDPSFLVDWLNVCNMVRYDPGVIGIRFFLVISEVRKPTIRDKRGADALCRKVLESGAFQSAEVLWKSNVGRDFSSAQLFLHRIASEASDEDPVMIKNRSGYGPLCEQWYSLYAELNNHLERGGLTGSTINQVSHPECRESDHPYTTHVQTYIYLSTWAHFRPLADRFPGSEERERIEVICKGELGLSRSFLERGLQLNALAWDGVVFSKEQPTKEELPIRDIKRRDLKLPIRYKYRPYLIRKESLVDGLRYAPLAWLETTLGGWIKLKVKHWFSTSDDSGNEKKSRD